MHRWALSEVFLCDSHRTDDTHFTAAAQLPLSYGYFRDRSGGEDHHGTLLVLEGCRQAVTYAAHVHQGVRRETTFMVTSWGLGIDDATALRCGERPGELHIGGHITHSRQRGGRLRRLAFAMQLSLDAEPLGTLTWTSAAPHRPVPPTTPHAAQHRRPIAFTVPATRAADPVTPRTRRTP
ncbi:AfsA-related hotdog domain-containing protein [Streptomyces sirii]|uniref:AfsA-related hotdog domain-containing protein n=1 Tax=Streptomyces sirii TaxID=3127701 RepID=UPI003D36D1B4